MKTIIGRFKFREHNQSSIFEKGKNYFLIVQEHDDETIEMFALNPFKARQMGSLARGSKLYPSINNFHLDWERL